MSGHWPPEWEDPEEEFPEEADQSDATVLAEAGEARLSEVGAYLASVPVPALPDAVEARINAALAAEAAGSRPLGPAPAQARVRRHSLRRDGLRRHSLRRHSGGGRPPRGFLRRPVVAVGSLVVCLLLAGLGFTLSRGSTPEPESSSSAAAGSGFAAGSSSAGSSSAGSRAAGAPGVVPAASASSSSPSTLGPQNAGSESSFLVTASGTNYQRATLIGQVHARSASSTSVGAAPSAALRGCVLHLTGGALPRLVDRATYQDEPSYVIASSTRVWVVGLGCTAAKTELIVSVALAGLPGNLRALVSVEQ
ncbi:MAG: hypothetical protein JWO75_6394 [Actinomycetia bacterium]|nr:hypothetical protein [Actinomycetes bacterium]